MADLPVDRFDVDVTEEYVAFYRADGYLSVERITTDEEAERLRVIFDELFAPAIGWTFAPPSRTR